MNLALRIHLDSISSDGKKAESWKLRVGSNSAIILTSYSCCESVLKLTLLVIGAGAPSYPL